MGGVPWVVPWACVTPFPFLGGKKPQTFDWAPNLPQDNTETQGSWNSHVQIPVWLFHIPIHSMPLILSNTSLWSPSAAAPSFPSDGSDPLLLLIPKERGLDNSVPGLWPLPKDLGEILGWAPIPCKPEPDSHHQKSPNPQCCKNIPEFLKSFSKRS